MSRDYGRPDYFDAGEAWDCPECEDTGETPEGRYCGCAAGQRLRETEIEADAREFPDWDWEGD